MKILNLLILDDDTDNIELYRTHIDFFNTVNDSYKFNIFTFTSLTKAIECLKNNIINYAIVDLRLNTTTGIPESGNELLYEIQNNYKIPTVVISGFLNDFDESEISQSYFLKCISRDKADLHEILNNFCSFDKCGLSEIFASGGLLDQLINNAFWNNIATSINPNDEKTLISKENILRYIGSYIKETLSYSSDGTDIDYHPLEFYFIPPINSKINNGSIIRYDDNYYINLTPSCDISNDKTINFQLVKIDSFESNKEISECLAKVDANDKAKVSKRLSKILTNNSSLKYHFLPPHNNFNGGLINFQTVVSLNKNDIIDNSTIIGSISPDFIKDISARFGAYYTRQGQPNLSNLEYIYNKLYENK